MLPSRSRSRGGGGVRLPSTTLTLHRTQAPTPWQSVSTGADAERAASKSVTPSSTSWVQRSSPLIKVTTCRVEPDPPRDASELILKRAFDRKVDRCVSLLNSDAQRPRVDLGMQFDSCSRCQRSYLLARPCDVHQVDRSLDPTRGCLACSCCRERLRHL